MAGYKVINFGGGGGLPEEILDDNGKIKPEYLPEGTAYTSIRSTVAGNTPLGVKWLDGSTVITGTLVPSSSTTNCIYFVKNGDFYDQYMTFKDGSTYYWDKVGSTIINAVTGLTYITVDD